MPCIYYGCKYRWLEGPPADAPQSKEEALARIDQLYQDGVPFFTKETIRSAWDQIQRDTGHDGKVLIKSVDGVVIEFDNMLKKTEEMYLDEDEKLILIKPVLSYDCRAHLTHRIWRYGSFRKDLPSLCSVSLYHYTETKATNPKEGPEPASFESDEAVEELFTNVQRAWGASESRKQLLHILNSSAAIHEITKVVAVSLGSNAWPRHDDGRESSPYQHAMLLTLREWVQEHNGPQSPCYTQDPGYVEIDHSILKKHGAEIVEDPQAWLEMDEASIVVSISSNVPSREMIADLARPAVVIWNRVTGNDYDEEGKPSLTDPCSPRVRAMMEGYEMFEFGADPKHFCDVVAYVRRPKTRCVEGC